MNVLIKGFEVPKDGCKDCAMVQRGKVFDICPFLKQEVNGNVERGGKPNGCPLIEVPDKNVGDMISRQAAIDALHMHLMYRMGTDSNKKRLDDWINSLPSAQPERKTGRWYDVGSLSCRCSECGCKSQKEFMFCPNCGADMRGREDG